MKTLLILVLLTASMACSALPGDRKLYTELVHDAVTEYTDGTLITETVTYVNYCGTFSGDISSPVYTELLTSLIPINVDGILYCFITAAVGDNESLASNEVTLEVKNGKVMKGANLSAPGQLRIR